MSNEPQPQRTGRFVGDGLDATMRVLEIVTAANAALARKNKGFAVDVAPYDDDLLALGVGVWIQGDADDVDTLREAVERRCKAESVSCAWTWYQPSGGER